MVQSIIKTRAFWILGFLITLIASQDYLFTKWLSNPYLLGLPKWIYYFMFLQVIFIVSFYFFSKKVWNEKEEGTSNPIVNPKS